MTDAAADAAALTILLDLRPDSSAEAAAVLGTDEATAVAVIESLAARGHLEWDGAMLGYPNPGVHAAQAGHRHIGAAQIALAALQGELDALAFRVDGWAMGLAARGQAHGIVHVADVAELRELWRHRYTDRPEGRIRLMVPDIRLSAVMSTSDEDSQAFIRGYDLRMQVLWSARDVKTPAQREIARGFVIEGIEYRVHPHVDHWFILSATTAFMQSVDEGFVVVEDPTTTKVLCELFDTIWSQSIAFEAPDSEGDALLAALATGLTVEAAAHSVGISTRTAQRRLSELMSAYGATSLFALGAAWERTRGLR